MADVMTAFHAEQLEALVRELGDRAASRVRWQILAEHTARAMEGDDRDCEMMQLMAHQRPAARAPEPLGQRRRSRSRSSASDRQEQADPEQRGENADDSVGHICNDGVRAERQRGGRRDQRMRAHLKACAAHTTDAHGGEGLLRELPPRVQDPDRRQRDRIAKWMRLALKKRREPSTIPWKWDILELLEESRDRLNDARRANSSKDAGGWQEISEVLHREQYRRAGARAAARFLDAFAAVAGHRGSAVARFSAYRRAEAPVAARFLDAFAAAFARAEGPGDAGGGGAQDGADDAAEIDAELAQLRASAASHVVLPVALERFRSGVVVLPPVLGPTVGVDMAAIEVPLKRLRSIVEETEADVRAREHMAAPGTLSSDSRARSKKQE
ncbi:unnamed protein product [Prorocentrum cordatum]|uniref:Myb-like domain-containing protein n=1 Tax=Prorocentrum cordatum TaxID=2364126 RepID=A0ABN9XBY1_9DINO|nr:unnamed protein product [Polarella glacialis]